MSDKTEKPKSDLINPAYWIGHTFAVIATVCGVYLAASLGFNKAVDLELLRADRGTYYVAQALLSQTEANLEHFEEYIEKTKGKSWVRDELDGMHVNDFVIESAKYSESTFELDPIVLTEVSQFYSNLNNAFDDYYPDKQTTLLHVVKKEVAKMKDGPLQRLEKHVEELRENCKEKGLDL